MHWARSLSWRWRCCWDLCGVAGRIADAAMWARALALRFACVLALRWRLIDSAQKSWKKFLHLYIEYVYNY